jgi:hypothetical protein
MSARPSASELAAIVAAYLRVRRTDEPAPPSPWKSAARIEATLARGRAGRGNG